LRLQAPSAIRFAAQTSCGELRIRHARQRRQAAQPLPWWRAAAPS